MAQDNGNITAFCTVHNHENIIVNIPELIEAALAGSGEINEDAEKVKVTVASIDEGTNIVSVERNTAITPATEQPEAHKPANVRRASPKARP